MDAEWLKSPGGRRVLLHWADPRPAWLWSGDGTHLLWRNPAAVFFGGKLKKSGPKLVPDASPIKGQVARLVRLGSPGRSSLSRIQFLAGDRPVSTTCICTPLELTAEPSALLIVGVDAIASELLATSTSPDAATHELLGPGTGYLVIDDRGRIIAGSPRALETAAPSQAAGELPHVAIAESAEVTLADRAVTMTRLKAGQDEASVLVFAGLEDVPEPEPVPAPEPEEDWVGAEEPLLPMGLPPLPASSVDEDLSEAEVRDEWVERSDLPQPPSQTLSSLFDRLANDTELYAGLEPPSNDELPPEPVDDIGALIDFDEYEPELEAAPRPPEPVSEPEVPVLYRVTARTIEMDETAAPPTLIEPEVEAFVEAPLPPDPETVERVSRYNFDELSRILTDRVAADPSPAAKAPVPVQPLGELVSLAGETFILNRLPLGILVFRDQQVQFANRAITEMVGYGSVEELRNAGLGAIFPATGTLESGPVNHLVQRSGTLLPVTARLQSISWQGRPALMLSASATEVRTGHETAVRAFAELLAESRDEGFIELNRAGIVSIASPRAMAALNRSEQQVIGKPLSGMVDPSETRALQEFLERPARFAETARPATTFKGGEAQTEILLFAQGQAGVITGYFGMVRKATPPAALPAPLPGTELEPALLARLSRGVRRPLNTIIGFADLIRSATFGAVGNERYAEYARDIRTAGQEITALVDELDDYARLRDGRYAPRLTEIDLKALLETCVVRVRAQAGAARVLVRSAISERLPRVRADRPSLGQAVLNLLASAIDQSPSGGSVILSAQAGDDGGIVINVRDSGRPEPDPGERFVVFRDGQSRDGETLMPVRSSVGLSLTRSLAAVNACALSIDPAGGSGTLFSLTIPDAAVITEKTAAAD